VKVALASTAIAAPYIFEFLVQGDEMIIDNRDESDGLGEVECKAACKGLE